MADLSNSDKEFQEKLEQTVTDNIPNESFGVSELASTLGMSRSNLHRKVNAISRITVSQYIRFARLKSGKELLMKTSDTVSEVAYKVGFNSPSYFIKCFHDYYGFPPGELSEHVADESDVIYKTEKSIAVLPLKSLSADPEKQYLADGVMDAILLHLSKIEDLRVVSRTSVEQYRDTDKTVNTICQELDVAYILEGSFQKYGDTARLIAQLIQPGKENHVWANEYDRNWNDIFAVQSEVAQTVANELHVVITPKEKQLIEKVPTENLSSYDAYLKGNFYFNIATPDGLDKAMQYFEQAQKMDPEFALTYTGICNVWLYRQQMGYVSPEEAGPNIFENLNKSLELDPDLSVALGLRALIAHVGEWDWEKSEKEYLKALAVNPNDAQSRVLYAQLLCVLQRTDEALSQGQLAVDLDPLNPNVKVWYGAILCAVESKAALKLAEEVTAVEPGNNLANNLMLFAAFKCKEYDKVIKAERYILPIYNFNETEIKEIEMIFSEQDFIKAYEKIMNHLEKFAEKNSFSPVDMAIRYIMVNQTNKAMDWLEKGFELHDPAMTYIATEMFNFESLFDNPRFLELVKRMNLSLPSSN